MKPFASRYLLVAAFSLILAACSNAPVEQATAPAQADAWQQLQQNIASNELLPPKTSWQHCRLSRRMMHAWSNTSANWPKLTCNVARSSCRRAM